MEKNETHPFDLPEGSEFITNLLSAKPHFITANVQTNKSPRQQKSTETIIRTFSNTVSISFQDYQVEPNLDTTFQFVFGF